MKMQKITKTFLNGFFYLLTNLTFISMVNAQEASVDIKLSPAGSFSGKSTEVQGFAEAKGDSYSAKNIVVVLKNIKTGTGAEMRFTYLPTTT